MKTTLKQSIEFSPEDIKKILAEYVAVKTGVAGEVSVSFRVSSRLEGFGTNEHSVTGLEKAIVSFTTQIPGAILKIDLSKPERNEP